MPVPQGQSYPERDRTQHNAYCVTGQSPVFTTYTCEKQRCCCVCAVTSVAVVGVCRGVPVVVCWRTDLLSWFSNLFDRSSHAPMNGSEPSTSAMNCFADTPEVPSISDQCPSLGRRRRGCAPGSNLASKMVRRRLVEGETGAKKDQSKLNKWAEWSGVRVGLGGREEEEGGRV